MSEDRLHGTEWVFLSLRTSLGLLGGGLVDLSGGLQSSCDCRVSRCTFSLGMLAVSRTSIACGSWLRRRSSGASGASYTVQTS